jgi:hypothetical protein
MKIRKTLVGLTISAVGVLGLSLPASALDCHNVSRADNNPVPASELPSSPIVSFPVGPTATFNVWLTQGNWYWATINDDTSGAVLEQWWGFMPPGTVPFAPGANGNYTNGVWDHLIPKASCNPNRQTTHGLQSLCGNGP